MMRKISAAAFTVGLAVTGALFAAGPVQAQNPHPCDPLDLDICTETIDDHPGGKLWFKRDGDRVELADTDEDGLRAVGNVYLGSKSAGDAKKVYTFYAEGGDGLVVRRASDGGKYNLIENRVYTFQVCLDDDPGKDRFCSYWEVYN